MRPDKPNLKLVPIPTGREAWYRFESPSGTVVITTEPGCRLTVERANWLLDTAKKDILETRG